MSQKIDLKFSYIFLAVLIIALARLIPSFPNFSPLAAIALFSGAHFSNKWKAFLLTIGAAFISDIVLNNTIYSAMFSSFTVFYEGFAWQYGSYILIAMLGGILLSKISALKVLGMSVVTSILFFFISNTGTWATLPMYTKDLLGLESAYIAGLPFLKATIFSDLLYSISLFGSFYLVQNRVEQYRDTVKYA